MKTSQPKAVVESKPCPTHFYLQRADEHKVWEEVDEYVFKNRDKAKLNTGDPRYSGNRICKLDDGSISLALEGVDTVDLGVVARFLEVKVEAGTLLGGFVRRPEFVKVAVQSNRVVLHEIGGENFKKAAS